MCTIEVLTKRDHNSKHKEHIFSLHKSNDNFLFTTTLKSLEMLWNLFIQTHYALLLNKIRSIRIKRIRSLWIINNTKMQRG